MTMRTMPKTTLLLCVLLTLVLGACGSDLLESKKIDYKSSGKLPPLDIPPDLTAPSRSDRYAVPDVNARGTATYNAYSAERGEKQRSVESTELLPDVKDMRVERAGSQRWLVVNASPEELWPMVKQFWQELGFIINVEVPEAGIMETDWAEDRAKIPLDALRAALGRILDQAFSTPERDKFRTRLERGAQSGTTEIYVSHRGVMEIYPNEAKDTTIWQPRPSDPGLEAEMLRRLMVHLGAEEARAQTLIASEPAAERARLRRGSDGIESLLVSERFDRTWRRVGLALDRVGFTVEDRDRSQGVYFVRYVDPEADADSGKKEEGWLSKLLFFLPGDDKEDQDQRAQYRIHVAGDGDSSVVNVLTLEGGQDNSKTAGRILTLLHEQLK